MIDDLTFRDIPRCAALEREMFGSDSPWPAAAFRSELNAPHNRYFAVRDESGGEAMGYAGISTIGGGAGAADDGVGGADGYECEVHTIAVAPERRGVGYGRALLMRLLDVADANDAPVYLEVRVDNPIAIALYERNGFRRTGIRRNYYQPSGTDAFTMRRPARSDEVAP